VDDRERLGVMGLEQKRGLAREESATRLEGSARGTTLLATTRVAMGMLLGGARRSISAR
jgi:hypothetical protein